MKNINKITIALLLSFSQLSLFGQKIVTLDNYYNHEIKNGKVWHYTWDDKSNGGFFALGENFKRFGGILNTKTEKPTSQSLKDSKVYIIVDPDNEKESANPNYMDSSTADEILMWVKKGGKLLLMTNDKNNCDLHHINILSEKVGIHFNDDVIAMERPIIKRVRHLDDCAFTKFAKHPITRNIDKLFLKGVCTITCSNKAKGVVFSDKNEVVIAVSKYGKGVVVAVTDSWLSNEYYGKTTLLPPDSGFSHDIVADNLVKYLLKH